MEKHFKISYQGVKDLFSPIIYFLVLWFVVNFFIGSITIQGTALEPLAVTFIIALSFIVLWFSYKLLGETTTDLVFWYFGRINPKKRWHDVLTRFDIKIPLTNRQHQQLKIKKLFNSKDCEVDYWKLQKWTEKIIYKELDKLIKNGK